MGEGEGVVMAIVVVGEVAGQRRGELLVVD